MEQGPTSQFRFALELEMHGIFLTFRQPNTENYWVPAVDPVEPEETMIALNDILIPQNTGEAGYRNPNPPYNIIWESTWDSE
jgi:hypothetical protein